MSLDIALLLFPLRYVVYYYCIIFLCCNNKLRQIVFSLYVCFERVAEWKVPRRDFIAYQHFENTTTHNFLWFLSYFCN